MVHPLFLQYISEMNHFLGGVCIIWNTLYGFHYGQQGLGIFNFYISLFTERTAPEAAAASVNIQWEISRAIWKPKQYQHCYISWYCDSTIR